MLDFKAKMHQIRFRLGLRPRPPQVLLLLLFHIWGAEYVNARLLTFAYSAPQTP